MWFFTGKGDEGEANLFDGRRLPKSDPVFELIGSLDETTATLGLAISFSDNDRVKGDLSEIQDHLSKLMGIVAGAEASAIGGRFDLEEKLAWVEDRIKLYGESLENPHAFIYAGSTSSGAAIDVARTMIRKAERIFTRMFADDEIRAQYLPYVNRLSSFLFILRLYVDNQPNSSS